jgi:class 3 adenylate cyclase
MPPRCTEYRFRDADAGAVTGTEALIEAGLYDPAAADAPEQLALLHWLLDQGVTLDQIAAAKDRGSIYRAGIQSLLWPDGGGLTVAEVAAAAGLPEATVRRARRLLGLADPGDEPVCHREEVDLLRALGGAMALFGEENALQFTRVLGTATASMAEAAISTFAASVARPMREAGATPLEYAQRVREATAAFAAARTAIDIAMRLQFAEALDRLALGWGESAATAGDEVDFTIGFVDLADSTRLTLESTANDFAAAVRDFEGLAAESAARHGARLVKLIGDGAMIGAPVAASVADAVDDLVAAIARDDRYRGAHGGIASGRVVARGGDYFGAPVNIADRLTDIAQPGEVLTDETTAARLGTRVDDLGERALHGLVQPLRVFRLNSTGRRPPGSELEPGGHD